MPSTTSSNKLQPSPRAIYFLVGDRGTGNYSYAWRAGTGGTSFYIKPVYTSMTFLKISVHGPDPRPGLRPGFKFEIDRGAISAVRQAGGCLLVTEGLPEGRRWFEGVQAAPGAYHVMRYRVTADLFGSNRPSAPMPGNLRSGSEGSLIPPPNHPLRAVDVDLYISERRPYWPREKKARRDNALLGPIKNKAGQYLTGISILRSTITHPAPKTLLAPGPGTDEDRIRGLAVGFDPSGFAWVCEQWMSRSALSARGEEL